MTKTKKATSHSYDPVAALHDFADKCVEFGRDRNQHMNTRKMLQNRLRASIVNTTGYRSGWSELDRKEAFKRADEVIAKVVKGEQNGYMAPFILAMQNVIQQLVVAEKQLEGKMLAAGSNLPGSLLQWIDDQDQRGFSLSRLALIVAETGDLLNYANPGKAWRRMGCAPYTKDDETLMGASWRAKKKRPMLSAEDWEDYGYSPRRRSVMYVISECLLKLNDTGPYRRRYDKKKAEFAERHPDYTKKRCHNHAMLLMGKLVIKNAWMQWWRAAGRADVVEDYLATAAW